MVKAYKLFTHKSYKNKDGNILISEALKSEGRSNNNNTWRVAYLSYSAQKYKSSNKKNQTVIYHEIFMKFNVEMTISRYHIQTNERKNHLVAALITRITIVQYNYLFRTNSTGYK